MEAGRQHQGMDRPGVRQVPEGSGEQGKMEKTGREIICGAPTTLTVKGLMMMMMMKRSQLCICGGLFPFLRRKKIPSNAMVPQTLQSIVCTEAGMVSDLTNVDCTALFPFCIIVHNFLGQVKLLYSSLTGQFS